MSSYFTDCLTIGRKGTFYIDGLAEVYGSVMKVGVDYIEVQGARKTFLIRLDRLLMFEPERQQ